jgi:hypothetical protein
MQSFGAPVPMIKLTETSEMTYLWCIRTRNGEPAGSCRRLFYCDSLSLDQYRCRDRARSKEALMKIVLLVVGPLFIAVGLFWFGQGTGLLAGPHNAVLIDAGAAFVAFGIGLVWFALR